MSTTIDVYKDWLGIPDGPRPPNHYELLRLVKFQDDADKIRANYKKLNGHVRKYASGQFSVRSQELLNELAKAMLCLTDPQAKREYDEGLGRVFRDEGGSGGPRTLGRILEGRGAATQAQIKEAEKFADARGLSLRDAVVQMKLTDAATAAQALAEELGRSYIDLADVIPDDTVLDRVPRSTVKRYSVLPLFIDDDTLLIACVDEPEHELIDELRLRFEVSIRPVIATPLAINQGIAKYYAAGLRDESKADEGLKAKSRTGTTKGRTKGLRKRYKDLTPEEQYERKQFGYIIMCWGTVASVLVDQFVLKGRLIPLGSGAVFNEFPFDFVLPGGQFLLSFFVPPIVIWWVFKVYWK
jgi:Type II secretion system (T2SS), protein E, N-terminal domain